MKTVQEEPVEGRDETELPDADTVVVFFYGDRAFFGTGPDFADLSGPKDEHWATLQNLYIMGALPAQNENGLAGAVYHVVSGIVGSVPAPARGGGSPAQEPIAAAPTGGLTPEQPSPPARVDPAPALQEPPEVGSVWRHYKAGKFYRVTGLARRESDGVMLVLYQPLGAAFGFVPWARTLQNWFEDPNDSGRAQGRAAFQTARFVQVS